MRENPIGVDRGNCQPSSPPVEEIQLDPVPGAYDPDWFVVSAFAITSCQNCRRLDSALSLSQLLNLPGRGAANQIGPPDG